MSKTYHLIRFLDGKYNRGNGVAVSKVEATQYPSLADASLKAETLRGVAAIEVIETEESTSHRYNFSAYMVTVDGKVVSVDSLSEAEAKNQLCWLISYFEAINDDIDKMYEKINNWRAGLMLPE